MQSKTEKNPADAGSSERELRKGQDPVAAQVIEQIDRLANTIDLVRGKDRIVLRRPLLSVVIPVFNEVRTIAEIIRRVTELPIEKQIVIVDDGSTDGTRDILSTFEGQPNIDLFFHLQNQGKGAALQTGFRIADGEIIIVQDADLEYDPSDIPKVIQPIIEGKSTVAFGSRYLEKQHQRSSFVHRLGNKLLTQLSNVVHRQNLTDMETCYKAFRREIIQNLSIDQRRFGFEPEITAKIAQMGIQITEVPVRYNARDWTEGKKIGLRDLWNAVYCIFRYRRWNLIPYRRNS